MKYKHQPTRKQIEGLRIDIKKDKKGNVKGVTVWTSDGYWVLDASVMKDKDEKFCRVYTGNRNQPLQFEYMETRTYPSGTFLELRSKTKS